MDAGPIAPCFGRPGHGLQFQPAAGLVPGSPSNVDVGRPVTNGYLERLT